jgi:autotransporter translocation and assembly factor TamB
MAELEAGLDHIRQSPADNGSLMMIVRRPRVDERELLTEARLDCDEGLVGDNWRTKGSQSTADGSAHPDMQLTIMNSRVIDLVAQGKERWPLAGDQLYVDLDLSDANLPAGTRLAIGSAAVEVTAVPHTGCQKFKSRFGRDAMKFVNQTKELHYRGINAKVVEPGTIRVGDCVRKLGR